MAKKIILISSLPICIALILVAIFLGAIGRGQPASNVFEKAKENINFLIDAGEYAMAESATDKLVKDFPASSYLKETLYSLIQKYDLVNRFEEAKRAYQQISQKYPDDSYAGLGVSREEVIFLIYSQDYVGAQKALDKLNVDFNGNPYLPESLYWIAEQYKWSKQYKDANTVYQKIIQWYPDSPWAQKAKFGASKAEVLSLIESKNYNEAKLGLDKLVADFAGKPDLPEALYWIAGEYNWSKQYEEANGVYQQIIEKYPENTWADKAKLGVIRAEVFSLINSQDYKGAEAAVDKMVVDFESHPDLPETLYWIADRYRWSNNRFEDANYIYQYLLENYPDSSYANKAELGISRLGVLSLIVAQDYNSAQSAFDKMVADFNGHPQLTEAVFQIGEEYYNEGFSAKDEANEIRRQEAKDRFQKAALVFEKIITELPESVPYTTDAYYLSGTCYYLRGTNDGDYNKAIDYFEQALANWPDSWHAGIAQGLIGVCYERLQASRALKEEEAYPLIEQAYKAVIEQYPDCPYYPEYACMRLGWMNFKKGKWADAAQYFELFLQKCPANDPRETDTLYYLGRSYEEMGELGPALQTYRLFLEKSAPASLDPNTLPSATPGAGGVCRPGSTNDRLIEDVKNRVERLEKMNNQ